MAKGALYAVKTFVWLSLAVDFLSVIMMKTIRKKILPITVSSAKYVIQGTVLRWASSPKLCRKELSNITHNPQISTIVLWYVREIPLQFFFTSGIGQEVFVWTCLNRTFALPDYAPKKNDIPAVKSHKTSTKGEFKNRKKLTSKADCWQI